MRGHQNIKKGVVGWTQVAIVCHTYVMLTNKTHIFQLNVLIQFLVSSTRFEHHVLIIGKTICTVHAVFYDMSLSCWNHNKRLYELSKYKILILILLKGWDALSLFKLETVQFLLLRLSYMSHLTSNLDSKCPVPFFVRILCDWSESVGHLTGFCGFVIGS